MMRQGLNMADRNSISVVSGAYRDHGRGVFAQYQWLWPDENVGIFTNFVAILLVFALMRTWKLGSRVLMFYRTEKQFRAQIDQGSHSQDGDLIEERDSKADLLTSNDSIERRVWDELLEAIEALGSYNHFEYPTRLNNLEDSAWPKRIYLAKMRLTIAKDHFLKGFLYFFVVSSIVTVSILSANIATNSIGLSASPSCGYFAPNRTVNDPESYNRYMREVQQESILHAQNCFDKSPGSDGCQYFLHNSIHYDIQENASCPFQDDMCNGGSSSAFKLTTGAVSSRQIGLNARKLYEFRRETTCSPITMNGTFIRQFSIGSKTRMGYFYGKLQSPVYGRTDVTYATPISEGFDSSSEYVASAVLGFRGNWTHGSWTPITALQVPDGQTATLIFITPKKVFYSSPRDDPIFPANDKVDMLEKSYWTYTGGHARVLGCVDTIQWRDPAGNGEWKNYTTLPKEGPPELSSISKAQTRGAFRLLLLSLLFSNIHSTLSLLGGQALNATRMLADYQSLPLAQEQWKVEVVQLFKASLSRILFDARHIARGDMKKVSPLPILAAPLDVCKNTYVFYTQGWRNVNIILSSVVLGLCTVFINLSLPLKTNEEEGQQFIFEWLLRDNAQQCSYYAIKGIIYFFRGRWIISLFRVVASFVGGITVYFKSKLSGRQGVRLE